MHAFLMPSLTAGATNHLVEAPDLDEIFERVPRDGIDSLFFPPTVWVGVANHPGLADADLASLRKAFYGASIMPVPVLKRLQARLPGHRLLQLLRPVGDRAAGLGAASRGARLPGPTRSAARSCSSRPGSSTPRCATWPPGEVGEVVYRSPQLCEGYWGKPEETEEAFRGGWFHSGDLCRIDEQGYLFVVDRIKDVINTGGVLVASREVEDALYEHDAVAEVAVIGLPHEVWIEAIAAVVVCSRPVSEEELIGFARERLGRQKVPKSVHFVDALPKNASGKLLKRELRTQLSGTESAVSVARG